jgi:hypothetical protein
MSMYIERFVTLAIMGQVVVLVAAYTVIVHLSTAVLRQL